MPIRSNIARAANRVAGQAPALSPDSKVVIFIRHVGKQDVCLSPTDTASIDDDRVMLLDLATAQPTQIATNSEASGCLSLAEPRFADATTAIVSAYGLGLATIHNLSVCVVDIPGHAIRLLGRRTTCALPITVGRYRGAFFVPAMDFVPGMGPIKNCRVVDRKGRVLRKFTEDPFAIKYGLLSLGCPDSDPFPHDKLEDVMKKM